MGGSYRTLPGEYYNEKGKIRLGLIRSLFDYGTLTFDDLQEVFDAWVRQDEWFVLKREEFDNVGIPIINNWYAVKCSKRGNDVYRWRVRNRLREVQELADLGDITFFGSDEVNPSTRCLFLTLTYDTKRCSVRDAWEGIGHEWNRYITSIRKKYGPCSVIRAWEGFENGFPHIHAILLFNDVQFDVFEHEGDWRIQEKEEFADRWHSFVDVSAVRSFSNSVNYLLKYLSKVNSRSSEDSKYSRTLSLMWLYHKRAFAISGQFARDLKSYRLDRPLHNSNRKTRLIQLDLACEPIKDRVRWTFWGLCPYSAIVRLRKNVRKEGLWTYELSDCPIVN